MNRSRERTLLASVALATTALVTLGATGCSSDSATNDPAGPVKLTIWVSSADQQAHKNLYEAWQKESGNELEVVSISSAGYEDALMTRWATGSRPDLMEWHPERAFLAGLNPEENLQQLDDMSFIERSGDFYENEGNWNDHIYAVVLSGPSLYGMYYNKNVFAEAGLEEPATYDQLMDSCLALQDKLPDVTPIFMAGGTLWPLTVLPFNLWGGHFEDGEDIAHNRAGFGDEGGPFLTALEKFKELQEAGCYNKDINTATEEQGFDAVYNGTAAIVFQTSGEYPVLEAAAGGDGEALSAAVGWGSVGETESWANFQPVPRGTYMAPKSGDAAKEAAARDFIEFATGDYYQTYIDELKVAPTMEGVEAPTDISPLLQEINDFYATAPKEPLFNANIAGFAEFVQLMPQLAAGQITPEELAAKEQASVEQASRAAGVEGW